MKSLVLPATIAACAGLAQADPVRLSHSTDELPIAAVGIACSSTAAPQTSSDNQFWREFSLPFFGISEAVTISQIEFGVETIALPTLVEIPVTINLFQGPAGVAPASTLDLIGTTEVMLGDTSLEVITADVTGVVDAGNSLVVEISVPDLELLAGALTGDVYFPGANSFGETAPSYISSDGCGTPEPVTYATIGFPDVNLVLVAVGETGGAVCVPDFDGDGSLTIFDFLAFQTAFDAGDLMADLDGDGVLTIFDFLAFQTAFDAGCP
ncbi:MAG: EF-hand domain-containing protein [Planctomycetota bacterium]